MKKCRAGMLSAALLHTALLLLPVTPPAVFAEAEPTLYYEDLTYTSSNGAVTITGCDNQVDAVVIPEQIKNEPVTAIAAHAFAKCSMSSIALPETITSIGDFAFYHCSNLQEIVLPEQVSLGQSVFTNCTSLSAVTLPTQMERLEFNTFFLCSSLKTITLPETLQEIGPYAFVSSGLESITCPDGITSIGTYAFGSCTSLTEITLPASVTAISKTAFNGCTALQDVSYGGSLSDWKFLLSAQEAPELAKIILHPAIQDPFVAIGDADTDGICDINDAALVLSYYSASAAGTPCSFTDQSDLRLEHCIYLACDIDQDGSITLQDAARILQRYALAASGMPVKNPSTETETT